MSRGDGADKVLLMQGRGGRRLNKHALVPYRYAHGLEITMHLPLQI